MIIDNYSTLLIWAGYARGSFVIEFRFLDLLWRLLK